MTNVKTTHSKPKNNNKLSLIFGGTIATILLLFLVKVIFFAKEPPQTVIKEIFKPKPKKQPTVVAPVAQTTLPADIEKNLKEKGFTSEEYLRLKQGNFNPRDPQYQRRLEQAKLIHSFKKKVHLDVELPPAMNYLDLDLDDNVATILGTTSDGKKTLGILATDQKVTSDQVVSYLQDNKEAFPFIEGHKFLTDQMITYPAPESTGLGPLKIIPATSQDGQGLYVAIGERKDGKGTYLFMMEAPQQYFDDNDDGLEKMLGTVKVNP